MSKFDGPQFINPIHTSFGQNYGIYQNPLIYLESNTKLSCENVNRKMITPGSEKQLNLEEKILKDKLNAKPFEQIDNKFKLQKANTQNIEKANRDKLNSMEIIDDFFISKGFIVKPTENQLNDFLKNIEKLNKNVIFDLLMEKINQSTINKIIKSLYIIESILKNRTDIYGILFKSKMKVFNDLRGKFPDKTIIKLSDSILRLLEETESTCFKIPSKSEHDTKVFSLINDNTNLFDNVNIMSDSNKNNKEININKEEPKADTKGFNFIRSNNKLNSQTSSNIESPINIESNQCSKVKSDIFNDLDKLYAEQREFQSFSKGNFKNYTINYHQNYHLDLSDFNQNKFSYSTPNVVKKIEDYELKSKNNHFDFVDDLLKKNI